MNSNNSFQDTLALIGRVLIAWLFVPSGFGKIMGFAGTAGYIASKGVPLPEVCAAIAIAAELGLGLLILVGWQTRWAALGLGLFTVVITFIFHNYWAVEAAQQGMQKMNFDKNLAIAGGLFALAAWGAGRLSVDGRNPQR
ncbi:DoxX family protein [Caenimonas aquaedulcis]|uniref:DoxX family protein n=1 Tax=Caenimonas aquaedulcis TaxID=2793270 RepID=A0A931H0X7_9BURK|nr:DoxX family protein [Caenimonas aquaedulcis]MBG9386544.1 DoxX family protein [Caenimonas aquaedulcis]